MPRNQNLIVQFAIRLTPQEAAQLDEIARAGGFSSAAQCARSIISEVLVDERASGSLPTPRRQ